MSFAIIKTGGKQYQVQTGAKIKVEKLADEKGQPVAEGKEVTFSEVLLTDNGQETTVGTPTIAGAKVTGKVIQQGRHPKITVVKYKNKTRIRSKRGHKQPYTEVEITSL